VSVRATITYTQNGSIANAIYNEVDHDGFIQSQIKGALKMRFKIVGLCLAAVFVMSAVVTTAAQATGGPEWITGAAKKALVAGETRAITSTNVGAFTLVSAAATITCSAATNTGFLLGGNPGTDFTRIVFTGCVVVGKTKCEATGIKPVKATNKGEVIVEALTVLVYPKGGKEGESALDAFAPEGEEGHPNLFVEFALEGGVTNCGTLATLKVPVEATGTEITVKTESRKCGQLSEVGTTKEEKFFLTKSGEVAKIGLLRLPETAVTEAELWEASTSKFKTIKCDLEAGTTLGKVHEVGLSQIEVSAPTKGEEFGWIK
jgi:hypothetical protein